MTLRPTEETASNEIAQRFLSPLLKEMSGSALSAVAGGLVRARSLGRNRYIAGLGDSRMARGWTYATNDVRKNVNGLQYWTELLSGARVEFRPQDDFGVNGDTTTQVLARLDTALASTASTFMVLVGTNDRSAGMTAAQTISNMIEIANRLVAAGKDVIWVAETPRVTISTEQNNYHQAVYAWQKTKLPDYGVRVADCTEAIVDKSNTSSWAPIQRKFEDQLHPTADGCFSMVRFGILPLIQQMFSPRDLLSYSGFDLYNSTYNLRGNLMANSVMGGTAGAKLGTPTPTGDVADSYTVTPSTATGMTTVASKQVVGSRELQRIAFTGTGSSTNPSVELIQSGSAVNARIAAGDVIQAAVYVDSAANVDLKGLSLQLRAGVGGAFSFAVTGQRETGARYMPLDAFSGVLLTPPLTLPVGVDELRVSMMISGYVGVALTSDIGFGNLRVWKQ